MNAGVYRHRRNGHYYLFVCLSRDHVTDQQLVTYVPLRIEPAWAGTLRHATRSRESFEQTFEWVGEALPDPL